MKFKQQAVVTAEYKISTPMFLGGAIDTEVDAAHFRNASFKGALRFWWRAINWGLVLAEYAGNQNEALKALHQREGELFGRASDGKDSAQSLLQITSRLEDSKATSAGEKLPGFAYLLGQGLNHFKTGTLRPFLTAGQLTVEVQFKPVATPVQVESVAQALTALGLFGGMGSRARKGLGSLSMQWLDHSGARREFAEVADIQAFISTLNFGAPGEAPLSAFTGMTRMDVSLTGNDAKELLGKISREQQLYRSYGKDGKVNGEEARRNFTQDHDNVLAAINGRRLEALPQRAVFGLPHNYHFSSGGDMNISPADDGRRASPLFIHIHEFPSRSCIAMQTLLPGMFLPEKWDVELKNPKARHRESQKITNPKVDYQVIHRYLDGFPSREVLRNGR